jgi:hypothetical protein
MSTESITQNCLAWSIRDFAHAIGVSTGLLRLEIARGRLRPARIGRRLVISRVEGERYLKAGEGATAR